MSTPADTDFWALVREIVDLDHRRGTRRPHSGRGTRSEQRRYAGLDSASTTASPPDCVDDRPGTLHSRGLVRLTRRRPGHSTGQTGPGIDDPETRVT